MYQSVFISHSKDDPHLDFFHKVFSGLNTSASWMEYEDINPPACQFIKNKLNNSNALFVLLSQPLLDLTKRHTANWVSFEIGLAANYRSPYLIQKIIQDHLDVYVFEPQGEGIDFAVPYCTYYMLYDKSVDQLKFLKELIQNAPNHNKGILVKCPYKDCQIEFKILNKIEKFVCPTCRKEVVTTNFT